MLQATTLRQGWNPVLGAGVLLVLGWAWGSEPVWADGGLVEVNPQRVAYQPSDFDDAGLARRVATGHAGFYRHGDDDASKRYSPYIEWHCSPPVYPAWWPSTTLTRLREDFARKAQRHSWGKGSAGK